MSSADRPGVDDPGLGRRLGVDVGAVRVGVALSDPGAFLATPLVTLARDVKTGQDLRDLAGPRLPENTSGERAQLVHPDLNATGYSVMGALLEGGWNVVGEELFTPFYRGAFRAFGILSVDWALRGGRR